MPRATSKPTPRTAARQPAKRVKAANPSLQAALAAPLSAASLRAAANQIDRTTPRSPAESNAMLRYVVSQFAPVLSGASDVLIRVQEEMTVAAETMDEGGTVMNWAGMLALVIAGFDQPIQDLEACLCDLKAVGGAA